MTPLQRQIQENFRELDRMKKNLGIKPTMKVTHVGITPTKSTFDLRSLNQNLAKKR